MEDSEFQRNTLYIFLSRFPSSSTDITNIFKHWKQLTVLCNINLLFAYSLKEPPLIFML